MSRKRTPKKPEPVLHFSDVTKHYGEVHALGPVSIEVPASQLVALLGHNGSGKSTLLAIAAGLLEPSGGTATIRGATAGEQPARAVVSYLPSEPMLYDDLSVEEHLEYLTRLHGSTPSAHDARQLLAELGLEQRVGELPSTFSRGLRQKAAIAIALCRPFSLFLVDEPFSGLDLQGRDALVSILERIRDEKSTAIVATHALDELKAFDRVLVLDHGCLAFDGPPRDLPQPAGGRTYGR